MFAPKLILKDETGKYYITANNFLVLPSEVRLIIQDLLEYCENNTDEEVSKLNRDFEEKLYFDMTHCKKEKRANHKGYIYIFQCADKYKIGFTRDVDRRFSQLDTRPFKLYKVFVSDLCVNAYEIEQSIHTRFKEFNVEGEWYSNNLPINDVIEYIKISEGY